MNLKSSIFFYIFILILYANTTHSEGFISGTLITTANKAVPIETLTTNDIVASQYNTQNTYNNITHTHHYVTNNSIKINIADVTISTAPDQLFYSATRNKWIQAQYLNPLESLLCANQKTIIITSVECINKPTTMYSLTVQTSHLYYIAPYQIIAHNFEPSTVSVATAYLSLVFPAVAPVAIATQAIVGGIACYFAYKKYNRNKTFAQIQEEVKNCSHNSAGPQKPDDDHEKNEHPHGIYKDAKYHHKNSRNGKSPGPKDGQKCLDYSMPYIEKQRIAIEGENFIILKQTSPGEFHGHTIEWKKITEQMQTMLTNKGYVKVSGKIIKQITEKSLL